MQVGKEKELASTENAAAMIEADKCAIIAKDVSELQARCEGELAAAAPLVAQAEAALNTLNKKDLGVLPGPLEVHLVGFSCAFHGPCLPS